MFCTALNPNSPYGTKIDITICAFNTNTVPFIFVDKPAKAIYEIEMNHDKQIIFISSELFGPDIIPYIYSKYSNVYSFYIFCMDMRYVFEFAYNYKHCLQVFNHELDLLVRLVRDISGEMIEQGKRRLMKNDPGGALDYFEYSRVLELTGNKNSMLNSRCVEHLKLLDGHRDQIGLIQQAKILKKNKRAEKKKQNP